MLEVADKLSEAVHYESDRIEALAQAVSREWKSFDMNINQRTCLLARSVAYHKHSEEVSYTCFNLTMGKLLHRHWPRWEDPILILILNDFGQNNLLSTEKTDS